VKQWEEEKGMETTLLKEPRDAHKNILKEEILQVITENFMEKILYLVNQNVQDALKKFQETKNKE
jgi:cell division ATPase FtsA